MTVSKGEGVKVGFDGSLRLEFHGAKVTSDADDFSPIVIWMMRWVYSIVCPSCFTIRSDRAQHPAPPHGLAAPIGIQPTWRVMKMSTMPIAYRVDPTMRRSPERSLGDKNAASANTMGRFETKMLSVEDNLQALSEVNGRWVERCAAENNSSTHHFGYGQFSQSGPRRARSLWSTTAISDAPATIPCFASTSSDHCEGSMLRPGNVHSADRWKELLEPIVARYERKTVRKYFGDACLRQARDL